MGHDCFGHDGCQFLGNDTDTATARVTPSEGHSAKLADAIQGVRNRLHVGLEPRIGKRRHVASSGDGSRDRDAAGEAFDKIARVMKLGFPGGPAIDKLAKDGNASAIDFPRGLTTSNDWLTRPFDFSFSGLKTAVARYLEATPDYARANVAASFQEAIVDVLLLKALAACKQSGIDSLVIAGGVAANSRLRAVAQERCDKAGIQLRVPSPGLCTDNGAMVAALGSLMVSAGRSPSPVAFDADSSLPVTTVSLS